ncbi:MAG: aminodeoxychorismate synthase component I [Ignavibacteriae bacterium]|nr:aminodeoxychorismate synthase component I [Ignavibacteriota bacterium]
MTAALPHIRVASITESAAPALLGDEEFVALCDEACRRANTVLLLSGGGSAEARRSWLFAEPAALLTYKPGSLEWRDSSGVRHVAAHPLDAVDGMLEQLRTDFGRDMPTPRFAGYFAYELKDSIERLLRTATDDLSLPEMWLMLPTLIRIHERATHRMREFRVTYTDVHGSAFDVLGATADPIPHGKTPRLRANHSTHGRDEYCRMVEKARTHIRDGDIYQINLSQRFDGEFEGDPFAYWTARFRSNPAPYYAWINAGDHLVLSTSMEQFLRREGDAVQSRPIKGTRPRGKDPASDAAIVEELLRSAKDDAELSMIVDLIRNDMSRVCLPGSVVVHEHKRVESYANVHHLVSTVRGIQHDGAGFAEWMRAMFPGGSITGCPRIRAMELIEEFEKVARHVYTGAIGHAAADGDIDLSVAIRTMILARGRFHLSVGGGIVHDSDPDAEYEETLAKARNFLPSHEDTHGPGSAL